MFVPYVELHAHTAFSFLDGASSPAELAAAAAEQGHSAMAVVGSQRRVGLDGVRDGGQAAGPAGDPRGRDGPDRTRRHVHRCWSPVTQRVGWRNLCRIVTRAHVHDREKHEPPPAVPLETLEEHAAGLVLLSGCADHGVHDEPTLRRLLAAFGPDHLRVELQRPFQRHDRVAQPGAGAAGAAARGADGGDRQRPRARALARAAAGRVRGAAPPPDAGRLRARAAGQHRARAVVAEGDGGALRGACGGGGGDRASWPRG